VPRPRASSLPLPSEPLRDRRHGPAHPSWFGQPSWTVPAWTVLNNGCHLRAAEASRASWGAAGDATARGVAGYACGRRPRGRVGAAVVLMGAPDLPGQSLLRSERKLVTVLVCQVDVPTASGQDDPEDVRRLLVGSLARVQAEVARHGGLVPEGIGDTVVAVFGVPRTRDDDAERAVQAALAIRAALLGAGGQLRAGVGTGQALVGGDDLTGGNDGGSPAGWGRPRSRPRTPPHQGRCWSPGQPCRRPSERSATPQRASYGCPAPLRRWRCGRRWHPGPGAAARLPRSWAPSCSAATVNGRCCWTATSRPGPAVGRSS
jgi:hypothetical protein